MSNTTRHLGILFFDLLSIGVLWMGFDNIKQVLMEINDQVDILRLGNRDGFFVVGIIAPLLHVLNLTGCVWPNFISRYQRLLNYSVIGLVVISLAAGFAGSSWLQSRAENAGYVHCRYISGVSALAKTLVYTKDAKLCEDLSAKARVERKRR
jgi:uncharacterized membrane protein